MFNIYNFFMKKKYKVLFFSLIALTFWLTTYASVFDLSLLKARDVTRISDIVILKWSLENYYIDHAEYISSDLWILYFIENLKVYQPTIPLDPSFWSKCFWWTFCWYIYNVDVDENWINNWSFEISTWFEAVEVLKNRYSDLWNCIFRLEVWYEFSELIWWLKNINTTCREKFWIDKKLNIYYNKKKTWALLLKQF